jgi:hypothetical protein
MKRPLRGTLAAASFVSWVHARSNASGSRMTPAGTLRFVRDTHDFVAMPFKEFFDRFVATTLVHFDEADWKTVLSRACSCRPHTVRATIHHLCNA